MSEAPVHTDAERWRALKHLLQGKHKLVRQVAVEKKVTQGVIGAVTPDIISYEMKSIWEWKFRAMEETDLDRLMDKTIEESKR